MGSEYAPSTTVPAARFRRHGAEWAWPAFFQRCSSEIIGLEDVWAHTA